MDRKMLLKKATVAGSIMMQIITAILIAFLILVETFLVWDIFRTATNAFASYDLLKYKPDISQKGPPYLEELSKENSDTVAWLTVYGTHIDYPVMQGDQDTDYLSTTPTGETSISGSIFLSSSNKRNFTEPYNLIYGHHMDNGAMFGDLDKFLKEDFFYNKDNRRYREDEGVLVLKRKAYDIHAFAILELSAYNRQIYFIRKDADDMSSFLAYARKHAKYWRDVGQIDKVVALSTCKNAVTYDRTILLCKMDTRSKPVPARVKEKTIHYRTPKGHVIAGSYWAVMNLYIAVLIIYIAFPLHIYAFNIIRRKKPKLTYYDVLTGVLAILSAVFFYVTENPHKLMVLIDKWTPLMIGLLIVVWIVKYQQSKSSRAS